MKFHRPGEFRRTGLVAFVLAVTVTAHVMGQLPEQVTLTTKDGVQLAATYYEGKADNSTTPVVMLPDHKDAQATFDAVARRMQSPGGEDKHEPFAVLTVDLRGHGGSTKQELPNGTTVELDAAKLRANDFKEMVLFDMEAVRRFLVGKNDDGKLNLNKLSIVGVGMGANVATIWTARDWSVPPLSVGKQGQDVKALVLISPQWKGYNLPIHKSLQHPLVRQEVAFMMVYGKNDSGVERDIGRIFKQLDRYHPKPTSNTDKPRDLIALSWPTSLQGSRLLGEIGTEAEDKIIDFLVTHVAQEEYEWSQRRNRIQ
jgi:pimeloyl-ACP methyl ester carboxylesterase